MSKHYHVRQGETTEHPELNSRFPSKRAALKYGASEARSLRSTGATVHGSAGYYVSHIPRTYRIVVSTKPCYCTLASVCQ